MNLAYPIKDEAVINGETYEVDMSFDNILRLFDLIRDDDINDVVKIETGLLMLINDELDSYETKEKAEIFIELFKSAVGKSEEKQELDLEGNPMPSLSEENKKTHDLAQDAEYIYASFMHTYRIDLFEQQGKLHWEKFVSLLNGLSEDSIFSRIVGIRTADLPSGKGSQKEREQMQKLKRKYALEEIDEEEEEML